MNKVYAYKNWRLFRNSYGLAEMIAQKVEVVAHAEMRDTNGDTKGRHKNAERAVASAHAKARREGEARRRGATV